MFFVLIVMLAARTLATCDEAYPSSIKIQSAETIVDPSICTGSLEWDIDAAPHTYKIRNTGTAIVLIPVTQVFEEATEAAPHDVKFEEDTNVMATITGHNADFCLDSLRIHWNKLYKNDPTYGNSTLEIQFIHYLCDNDSNHWNTSGEAAVVILSYNIIDDSNPVLGSIFNNETVDFISEKNGEYVLWVSLFELIPDGFDKNGYIHTKSENVGCDEIVSYYIMNKRGYIGKEQLLEFSKIYVHGGNKFDEHIGQSYSCTNKIDSKDKFNLKLVIIVSAAAVIFLLGILFLIRLCKKKFYQRTTPQPPANRNAWLDSHFSVVAWGAPPSIHTPQPSRSYRYQYSEQDVPHPSDEEGHFLTDARTSVELQIEDQARGTNPLSANQSRGTNPLPSIIDYYDVD